MPLKLHRRTLKVQKARCELSRAFWEELRKHHLTFMEALGCLMSIGDELVKYGIRQERHPNDPDARGDEA